MKKKLFKTRLLTFAVFCGLTLAFASCASEDVAQGTTDTGNESDKNLTTFVAGDEAKTRTSMDYTTGNFYWEAGDYIYVKDDDGTWQKSNNAPTSKVASFKFKVPGKFKNHTTYKVYYPGKNGNQDQVTISAAQTQATPNTTDHFGVSGDCGTADASKQSNGSFAFALDHQAAILVFQPYTSNTVLQNCYLTKVEVSSDNDITHTYTLDPTTGELTGAGSGKQIILTTKGSGTYTNGFPLTNSSASVTTNGAYMIIKPGTHALKVRYWLKDYVTNVEGTITKALSSFNYDKNTFYDMTADLNIRNYDGHHYYMWDAQNNYWHTHEWDSATPWQPTIAFHPNYNYPQDGDALGRYYNKAYPGLGVRNDPVTPLFKSIPNANEMTWYLVKGDARYDSDELWTSMGHLNKGGIWLKKKSVLQAEGNYSTEKSYDGVTDLRVTPLPHGFTPAFSHTPLSAAEANKYFYLPALGSYVGQNFTGMGHMVGAGYYWTSTTLPDNHTAFAYCINFTHGVLGYDAVSRGRGFIAQPFSDFGDN